MNKTTGIDIIAAERKRQIEVECWDAKHDRQHDEGELAIVAACYAVTGHRNIKVLRFGVGIRDSHLPAILDAWPYSWDADCDKRNKHPKLRRLAIAGALIAAEIDRLQAINPVADNPESHPHNGGHSPTDA